jgi:hypothetical protein
MGIYNGIVFKRHGLIDTTNFGVDERAAIVHGGVGEKPDLAGLDLDLDYREMAHSRRGAVLPFAGLTADPDQECFAEGIVEGSV